MAVSDINRHRQRAKFWKRLLGQLSRYDLLLAAIPLVLALALVAHLLTPISLYAAVGVGSVLSGVFVADALYFHPPTSPSEPTETASSTAADSTTAGTPPTSGD